MLATGGRAAIYQKADSLYPTSCPADKQWVRAFIDRERGLHAETAVSSGSHLEIGHAVYDQHHFDCFRYSEPLVPRLIYFHFLRPLGIVAADVMAMVQSSCS